jgi:hypothetical protein
MEDKEVEKKLKESAENIDIRGFSQVWEDIKDKIESPKRRKPAYWLPLAASVIGIIIGGGIIIPIALQNVHQANIGSSSNSSEQTYQSDKLNIKGVTPKAFYTHMKRAGVDIVDVNDYVVMSSVVYQTEDFLVKGGLLELTDDEKNPTFFLSLEVYDQSVEIVGQSQRWYDFEYSVNDVHIQYRVKASFSENGVYIYDIKASLNTVDYYMEYTCFTEDIKPFLDTFFNKDA